MTQAKHMKLGTGFYSVGKSLWAWLDPQIDPAVSLDFEYYRKVTLEAEAAKLDFIFLGDGLFIDENSWPERLNQFEPMTLLSALAAETSRIGLVCTQSTSFSEPFTVAQQFASLDNISGGRAGWNVVTSGEPRAALNFSMGDPIPHDERYRMASEHVDVVRGLWDSWDPDAVVPDASDDTGRDPGYPYPDHQGKYFSVQGPLNIARSPQGQPVLLHAGASGPGVELGARVADIVIMSVFEPAVCKATYARFKEHARTNGRSPDDIVVLNFTSPIVGSTDEEAERRYEELAALTNVNVALHGMNQMFGHDFGQYPLDDLFPDIGDIGSGGWKSRCDQLKKAAYEQKLTLRQTLMRWAVPRPPFVGSPERIADGLESWVRGGHSDGFIFNLGLADTLSAVIEHVLPILRARGLYREDYDATTLRGHLGLPMPASRFSAT